eukprot:COSAG02_NODE_56067_length_287_cov_0.829787_1_plen_41_part_10
MENTVEDGGRLGGRTDTQGGDCCGSGGVRRRGTAAMGFKVP